MATGQAVADELEERLIDFAVKIIRLSGMLPNNLAGKHIARQILRAGTSPAPNYGEARGAESKADFVHKLALVLKELNETSIWLRTIRKSGLLGEESVNHVLAENRKSSRIITASIKTARGNRDASERSKQRKRFVQEHQNHK